MPSHFIASVRPRVRKNALAWAERGDSGFARVGATPLDMTSRRIISEKNILEKDDQDHKTPRASEKSNITPAVPACVLPSSSLYPSTDSLSAP